MSDCRSIEEITFHKTTTNNYTTSSTAAAVSATTFLSLSSIPNYFMYNCFSLRAINPVCNESSPLFGLPLPPTSTIGTMFMGNCHTLEAVNLTGIVKLIKYDHHEVLCTEIGEGFMSGCKALRNVHIKPLFQEGTGEVAAQQPLPTTPSSFPIPACTFAHCTHLLNAFGTQPLPPHGDSTSSNTFQHLEDTEDFATVPRALATDLHNEYLHSLSSKRILNE